MIPADMVTCDHGSQDMYGTAAIVPVEVVRTVKNPVSDCTL